MTKDILKNGKLYFACRQCQAKLCTSKLQQEFVRIDCPECQKSYYIDSTGQMRDRERNGGAVDFLRNNELNIVCRNKACRGNLTIRDLKDEMKHIQCGLCKAVYWVDTTGQMRDCTVDTSREFQIKKKLYSTCRNVNCRAGITISIGAITPKRVTCTCCKTSYALEKPAILTGNNHTFKGPNAKNITTAKPNNKAQDSNSSYGFTQSDFGAIFGDVFQKQPQQMGKQQTTKQQTTKQQTNTQQTTFFNKQNTYSQNNSQTTTSQTTNNQNQANRASAPKVRKIHFIWLGEFSSGHDRIMSALKKGQPVHPIVDGEVLGDVREQNMDVPVSALEHTIGVSVKSFQGFASQCQVQVPAGNLDYNVYVRMLGGKGNVVTAPVESIFVDDVISYIKKMVSTNRFRAKFGKVNASQRVEIHVNEKGILVQFPPAQTKGLGEWSTGYRTEWIRFDQIGTSYPAVDGMQQCRYICAILPSVLSGLDLYEVHSNIYDYVILEPFA